MWALGQLRNEHVEGKDVLEVGALNVNGSLRGAVCSQRPRSYVGVDIRPGPGVDLVDDAANLAADQADLVICTEMLEHARDWRPALRGMYRALRHCGYLLITTRGPGFSRHDHPGDYWRFTPPVMAHILVGALGMDLLDLRADPDHPGVFAFAQLRNINYPVQLHLYSPDIVD